MSYTLNSLIQTSKNTKLDAVSISDYYESIQNTISLFQEIFQNYNQQELTNAIPQLYSDNAFLNDRIHSIQGMENIKKYFDSTFDKVAECHFKIVDRSISSIDAYLRWEMMVLLKGHKKSLSFLGISQLRFNKDSKIIYHQDFWDFSELLSEIRYIRSIVKFAKKRA